MLNISNQSVTKYLRREKFNSFIRIRELKGRHRIKKALWSLLFLVFVFLFVPWTQNIVSKGYVTTLRPEQRPQAIQSVISGRLQHWYVREGDYVNEGDTVLYITEVKNEYFDPELVDRTEEQFLANEESIGTYGAKADALQQQYRALADARNFKIKQTKNKIQQTKFEITAGEADLQAIEIDNDIAKKQLDRNQELFDQGLKSLTDLEGKKLKYQETSAKVVAQKNKLLTLDNKLLNLEIELSGIESEYADKMAKSQSDRMSAVTSKLDAKAKTSKLKNQLSNYSLRQQFYYILAPQSGYITQAVKKGVGEIVKDGEDIVTIMPERIELAVEVYVEPIDIPLLKIGQEARLLFDGWPAIFFSGWPNTSVGTFKGNIVAIDRFISDNGKYRILVAPNEEDDKKWPELIRVGSGTRGLILLNNVPLWYELWRQMNGFPADFYKGGDKKDKAEDDDVKLKAPLKQVK